MDMTDNILYSYENGNTTVTILNDGTKIREYESISSILFPESIDLKITNYCDLGCSWCHENSTVDGKHCNIENILNLLSEANFPKGIELAIGGGNPLAHPDLIQLLYELKNMGFICNITVNQKHLKKYLGLLINLINSDLIKGLGISINSNNYKEIKILKQLTDNIVYHLIIGINPLNEINDLIELGKPKILLLGYKTFGRGKEFFNENIAKNINHWKTYLPKYIGKCLLSFDNLAIEQLNLKRLFTEEGWKTFYMGDDFTYTMYIDAVNEEYAPTSRSYERVNFNNMALLEYFGSRNERNKE